MMENTLSTYVWRWAVTNNWIPPKSSNPPTLQRPAELYGNWVPGFLKQHQPKSLRISEHGFPNHRLLRDFLDPGPSSSGRKVPQSSSHATPSRHQ